MEERNIRGIIRGRERMETGKQVYEGHWADRVGGPGMTCIATLL